MMVKNFYAQKNNNNPLKKPPILVDSIVKDTIKIPKKYGLRLGMDIAGLAYGFYKKDFKQILFAGDYRINRRLFMAGESGFMAHKNIEDLYTYQTDGFFMKAGVNYNTFENWLEMDNEIYFGFRYAFASFNQTLKNYTIFQRGIAIDFQKERYFPTKKLTKDKKYVNLNAQWLEISLGVKTELFTNFYVAAEVAFKRLLFAKEPEGFKNLYIPGFYTIYEGGTGFALSYILSYRISLYKK